MNSIDTPATISLLCLVALVASGYSRKLIKMSSENISLPTPIYTTLGIIPSQNVNISQCLYLQIGPFNTLAIFIKLTQRDRFSFDAALQVVVTNTNADASVLENDF